MKRLRTVGAACVLALALAAPAFAGHIATGIAPPPPPSESTATEAAPTDSITGAALSLLDSILALF